MCQIYKLGLHRRCSEQKIHLTIMWKGERVDICKRCWEKYVSDSELEWGDKKDGI